MRRLIMTGCALLALAGAGVAQAGAVAGPHRFSARSAGRLAVVAIVAVVIPVAVMEMAADDRAAARIGLGDARPAQNQQGAARHE